ncbi:MAG: hypothetical protein M1825_000559 [Sarcosagium campestre]|nr:MAG: hypothetical protein M1825_000559 [Sarcosagium campestre]
MTTAESNPQGSPIDTPIVGIALANRSDPADTASPLQDEYPEIVRSKAQLAVIIAALCLSLFLAALDFVRSFLEANDKRNNNIYYQTIIATALPTISEEFHSPAAYTWVGSAYLLANAASTPIFGKLSDIWGRKTILLVAVAIFFFGSLLCGVSPNVETLIAGRAVQGGAAGGLVILVNICISDLFSMRVRGAFLGLTGVVWATASALGPVLGGAFTELVSWRWCFYINLPCSGAAFIAILTCLKLQNTPTSLIVGLKAIDWLGSLAIVGLTLMLLLGLDFGGVIFAWDSPKVICLIVFGLVMGGVFLLIEGKVARYPLMPLHLFKRRSNVAALLICFCHGFVYISGSYYLPLFFQAVRGSSPLASGVDTIPLATIQCVSGVITGLLIHKTGRYLELIWAGMIVMTLGFGLFVSLSPSTPLGVIVAFEIVAGLGIGTNFQSPLIALQSLVSSGDTATATATFGFIRNIATSMSIAIGGVVFQNGMARRERTLLDALGPENGSKLSGVEAGANVMLVASLPEGQRLVARKAYSESLKTMWILYVSVSAVGMVASAFIGKQTLSKEHVETRTGLGNEKADEKARLRRSGSSAGVVRRANLQTDAAETGSVRSVARSRDV